MKERQRWTVTGSNHRGIPERGARGVDGRKRDYITFPPIVHHGINCMCVTQQSGQVFSNSIIHNLHAHNGSCGYIQCQGWDTNVKLANIGFTSCSMLLWTGCLLSVSHKLLCTQLVTLVLDFLPFFSSLLYLSFSHSLAVCDLLIQQHTPTCPSKSPNRWCSNDLPFPTPSSSPGPVSHS